MHFIRTEEDVGVEDVEVYVLFSYSPGYAPTLEQPGEAEEVEILKAYLDDDTPEELTKHEQGWLKADALKDAQYLFAQQQGNYEPYS